MTAVMGRPKTDGAVAELAERRSATRVLVDHEVDYRSEDTYLFASARDISATGIFLRTLEPLPPGTRVNLRFSPPPADEVAEVTVEIDDSDEPVPFEVEGVVMWINPYRPGVLESIDPGMGVRFVGLRPHTRERLLELIRRIAYID